MVFFARVLTCMAIGVCGDIGSGHAVSLYVNVKGATQVGFAASHPATEQCSSPCGILVGRVVSLDLKPVNALAGADETYFIDAGINWNVSITAPASAGDRVFSHWSGCDLISLDGQCRVGANAGTKQVTANYFVPTSEGATGLAVPELASYDAEIQRFMTRWGVPGASVAVAREGKLIFARGYGVADPETGAPVQPDSLFRVASLSKPITAAAVMRLVQDGRLTLDLKVFPFLNRGAPTDPRLNDITVTHLLEHTAGWDRDTAGDPMFNARQIASQMNVVSPPDADTILRWMLKQPLQFQPGARYAYSNFGYLVLGQLISKASGQPYEDYVRHLLREAGITRVMPGASLPAGRLPGEVAYAMPTGHSLATSVFSATGGTVPRPYGGFALEPMLAHGGWVASAIDLVAFAAAMDGHSHRPDILNLANLQETARRPAHSAIASSFWYGKGWQVNTAGNWWHTGSLPGTASLLVRASSGLTWAVLLNLRSENQSDAFFRELDSLMWVAQRGVQSWSTSDQFSNWLRPASSAGLTNDDLSVSTNLINADRSRLGLNVSFVTKIGLERKVFIWASLEGFPDLCHSPESGWTFAHSNSASIRTGNVAEGTARCTEAAFSISNVSTVQQYQLLNTVDLSDTLFDGIQIFAAFQEPGVPGLIDKLTINRIY